MFWGLIMEPNKRYTQVVEKPFHVSQAAMDTSTGDTEPCQVMVVVDNKNFLICTLQKNKIVQVPLDLYFKSGEAISFLINGKCNVHLTGYLDPEFEDALSDEEAEEEEEEEQKEVPASRKRKLAETNNSANKLAKHDKKAAKGKQAQAPESSDDDDDDEGDDALKKILDGEDIETDENDETFNMNSSADVSSDEDEDDDDEEEEEQEKEDDDDEDEEEEKSETTLDTSKEEKVDMSKLSKSQKRRLKKKLQQQAKKPQPQVNGVDKTKNEKQEKKAEKKKEVKKEAQDGQATEKREKKSLSGGVMIEDTKVGTGPLAKPGKVVMVYYEGRLKDNNKMFDNCTKGPGFKFRLGAKEVINGWDIGIAGMKVGGKRKIVCPPQMAYGAKGSPPAIPPNSTLVFEVELKNIK